MASKLSLQFPNRLQVVSPQITTSTTTTPLSFPSSFFTHTFLRASVYFFIFCPHLWDKVWLQNINLTGSVHLSFFEYKTLKVFRCSKYSHLNPHQFQGERVCEPRTKLLTGQVGHGATCPVANTRVFASGSASPCDLWCWGHE